MIIVAVTNSEQFNTFLCGPRENQLFNGSTVITLSADRPTEFEPPTFIQTKRTNSKHVNTLLMCGLEQVEN